MTELTLESARQYRERDVYTECGGLEVARTETRMAELRRRMDSSKNWAIDSARLLTPAEIKELVPFIDTDILVGGFYVPRSASATRCGSGRCVARRPRRWAPSRCWRTPRSLRWASRTVGSGV